MTTENSPIDTSVPHSARIWNYWLGGTDNYLAGQAGVRQFLAVGAGLPTAVSTHEAANQVTPDARTVHVDNDPLVLVLRGPEIPQIGAVGRKQASLCSRNSTLQEPIRPGSTTSTWAARITSPSTGKPG